MTKPGKRWTVHDREGNFVYLTEERWQHIIDANNHPEVEDFESHLKSTIQKGQRKQEPLNPRKYRYTQHFSDLPDDLNHLVAVALFGFDVNEQGDTIPSNFVATAFLKHIRLKGGEE